MVVNCMVTVVYVYGLIWTEGDLRVAVGRGFLELPGFHLGLENRARHSKQRECGQEHPRMCVAKVSAKSEWRERDLKWMWKVSSCQALTPSSGASVGLEITQTCFLTPHPSSVPGESLLCPHQYSGRMTISTSLRMLL